MTLLNIAQQSTETNLITLKQCLQQRDPENTGTLRAEQFQQGLQEGNCVILKREFDELLKTLDPKETGSVNYRAFLDSIYVTRMFLQEIELYHVLQEADTEGRGGITIAEMKQLLFQDQRFRFPEEALGAAFQAMLNADINTIEPECIIDTEKFIQSLHNEFENVSGA